jgi:hypothetical protein
LVFTALDLLVALALGFVLGLVVGMIRRGGQDIDALRDPTDGRE